MSRRGRSTTWKTLVSRAGTLPGGPKAIVHWPPIRRSHADSTLPATLMGLDPSRRVIQVLRPQLALARPTLLLGRHELGLLEDSDVLHQAGQRHVEGLRKLSDGRGSVRQPLEDVAPRRIGERR